MSRLEQSPWMLSFLGAALAFAASIFATHAADIGGIASSALSISIFMVLAGIAQMFVITLGPGNIDLSIAANIGLSSAVAMTVMRGDSAMIAPGIVAAIGCGVAIGVGNYLLIWLFRIPPIIATLSTSFIIQSVDIAYGRGLQTKPPAAFSDFTSARLFYVPVLPLAVLLFTLSMAILLRRTIYGRSVLAIGQNIRAAELAGVTIERYRGLTYLGAGGIGGLLGALLAGYFRGASVDLGNEYLLGSIAVVVVGGTSVAGGEANLPGLWGASLFMVLLLTMLNSFGAGAGLRLLLTGLIIIAVIAIAGGRKKPQ